MLNAEEFGKDNRKGVQKTQHKAFECLSLIMILDKSLFKKHIGMLTGFIQNEQNDRKKSAMIYVALKCIFDCLIVNGFMLDKDEETQESRSDLRKLLMRQLRDMDYNVRHIATEGFCKLLMCERIHNPEDYLSRLILLKFDRPTKDIEEFNNRRENQNSEQFKENKDKILIHMLIKKTLDDFFSNYARLSNERCSELCLATL